MVGGYCEGCSGCCSHGLRTLCSGEYLSKENMKVKTRCSVQMFTETYLCKIGNMWWCQAENSAYTEKLINNQQTLRCYIMP
jgi:hypothetical protein